MSAAREMIIAAQMQIARIHKDRSLALVNQVIVEMESLVMVQSSFLHQIYCIDVYTDINECTTHTDNCSTNAQCTNTAGGFTCKCNAGYQGDGVTCTGNFVFFSNLTTLCNQLCRYR